MPRLPFIDPENFNAGYLTRALDQMPRRLDTPEWMHTQDYLSEKPVFEAIDLTTAALSFT